MRKYLSEREKQAIEYTQDTELSLNEQDIDIWFIANKLPSVTRFALDFQIPPSELKAYASEDTLVELALYRIISVAEEAMYEKVYGPKAVIQRVELYLPVSTVSDKEVTEGLYEASSA